MVLFTQEVVVEKIINSIIAIVAIASVLIGTVALIAVIDKNKRAVKGQIIDRVVAQEGDTCMTLFRATAERCVEDNIDPARKSKAGEVWYLIMRHDDNIINRLVIVQPEQILGRAP